MFPVERISESRNQEAKAGVVPLDTLPNAPHSAGLDVLRHIFIGPKARVPLNDQLCCYAAMLLCCYAAMLLLLPPGIQKPASRKSSHLSGRVIHLIMRRR